MYTQEQTRVGYCCCISEHADQPKQAPLPATHFHCRLSFDGLWVVVEPHCQTNAQSAKAVSTRVSILIWASKGLHIFAHPERPGLVVIELSNCFGSFNSEHYKHVVEAARSLANEIVRNKHRCINNRFSWIVWIKGPSTLGEVRCSCLHPWYEIKTLVEQRFAESLLHKDDCEECHATEGHHN